MPRLSAAIDAEVWIKRDDLTGFAGGGNKGRKLEYLMQHAIDRGHDAIVTHGASQSNFVRQCAAACSMLKLDFRAAVMDWPYPDLARPVKPDNWSRPAGKTGNEVLTSMLEATTKLLPDGDWDALAEGARSLAEELSQLGKNPLVIPAGGSTGVGALGFVRAVDELMQQDNRGFDNIIVASGSGSTQTGLAYGLRRANVKTHVIGICTDNEPEMVEEFVRVADELDELLVDNQRLDAADFDLRIEFAGEGYQVPTQDATSAQTVFAKTEGIFLDPVYTAKAAAGLLALANRGELSGRTLFWHTGGFPALFAA